MTTPTPRRRKSDRTGALITAAIFGVFLLIVLVIGYLESRR